MKVLVFHSNHCGPCKVHMKNIEKLKSQYPEVGFEEILTDSDENESLVDKYGIRTNPTTVFIPNDDSKSIIRISGLMTIDKIKEVIDANK